jgi:hypothetical protein
MTIESFGELGILGEHGYGHVAQPGFQIGKDVECHRETAILSVQRKPLILQQDRAAIAGTVHSLRCRSNIAISSDAERALADYRESHWKRQ